MKGTIINPFSLIKAGERPSADAWLQFALTFFLSVGIGLFLTGVIFFFAYNWVDLHHLAKLSIIGASITASCIGAIFCKKKPMAQQLLLLVASVMVGVLLAVYGQAYQLQSDSGFLAWAIFIALWAVAADFDVLWLVFVTVLQIGVGVALGGTNDIGIIIHFIFLALIGIFAIVPYMIESIRERSRWFVIVLFTASAIFTIVEMIVHYEDGSGALYSITFLAVALFYGWKKRDLSVMTLGFLVVVVEIHELTIEALLFTGTFTIIGSILCYVWFIKKLRQMWNTPVETTNKKDDGNAE